jgi:hypothetical protein
VSVGLSAEELMVMDAWLRYAMLRIALEEIAALPPERQDEASMIARRVLEEAGHA